jgi:hypothetical protein
MRRTRLTRTAAAAGLATLVLFSGAACAESEGGEEQETEQQEGGEESETESETESE